MHPWSCALSRLSSAVAIVLVVGIAVVFQMRAPAAVAQSASQSPPRSGSSVLADVDGVPITADDVTKSLGTALSRLEQQMYEMKRQRLDALIGDRLIAREAARRGVPVSELVEREVT